MPMYQYRCRTCGDDFEELLSSGETDDDVSCPSCGEHAAQRRLSAFAVRGASLPSFSSSSSCGSGGFS